MAHVVTEKAQRPARMDGSCFYCKREIGQEHKDDCVLVCRKVMVRMTIEYEIEVPASWDRDMIEFARNDGTWCADNALEELSKISDDDGCLCSKTRYEYISDSSGAFVKE